MAQTDGTNRWHKLLLASHRKASDEARLNGAYAESGCQLGSAIGCTHSANRLAAVRYSPGLGAYSRSRQRINHTLRILCGSHYITN